MIIQFFKGPKDGTVLEVPNESKIFRCEIFPPLFVSPEGRFDRTPIKTEIIIYYIEKESRPDGVYWAILEGVRVS